MGRNILYRQDQAGLDESVFPWMLMLMQRCYGNSLVAV